MSFGALPEAGAPTAWVSLDPLPALPPGAVVAVSFEGAAALHPAGCACCAGRTPAAEALDRLFQARVRGTCAWFDRVVAEPAATLAIAAALREDALASARYRLA